MIKNMNSQALETKDVHMSLGDDKFVSCHNSQRR